MRAFPAVLAFVLPLAASLGAGEDVLLRAKIPQVAAPITIDVEIGGSPHSMIFDSTASAAVFAPALRGLTGEKIASGSMGETQVAGYRAPLMKAQDLLLAAPIVAVADLEKVTRLLGPKIDGIVGFQNFGARKVLLDHDRLVLEVHSGPWKLTGPAAREADLDEGTTFETEFDGRPLRLQLATGSDDCVTLPAELFDALSANGAIKVADHTATSHLAEGDKSVRTGWFTRGELMGRPLAGVSVASGNAGAIGRAWLRGLNIEIDVLARKLRYEPCAEPSPPLDTAAMFGADFIYEDGVVRLQDVSYDYAARAANLRKGDEIESFGPLKAGEMNAASVSDVIAANAGKSVTVRYRRKIDDAPATAEVKLPPAISRWNFAGRDDPRPAADHGPGVTLLKLPISPQATYYVTEAAIDGGNYFLILDTGAARTVIDSSHKDLTGSESTGITLTTSNGEKIPVAYREGKSIEAQSLVVERPAVALADLRPVREFIGGKLDGMLGYRDFAGAGKVLIDYDKAVLEIHTGDWRLNGSDCREVALLPDKDVPAFRTGLSGHEVEVAIDTGSNGAIDLPPALFDALVKAGAIRESEQGGHNVSLSGMSAKRRGWFLEGELMGKNLRGVAVSTGSDHVSLGLTWLCGFNVEIDRRAGLLRYQRRSGFLPPANASKMTGFAVTYGERGPEVRMLDPNGGGPAEKAGLQPGDLIERFGPLAARDMNFASVTETVAASAGKPLDVVTVRKSDGARIATKLNLPPPVSDWNFSGHDFPGAKTGAAGE